MHIASVAVLEGPSPPFADVVARVRGKLAQAGAPERVQTVRGVGFRLSR